MSDSYLRALPLAQRRALTAVRDAIRAAMPERDERISSGAPFFWHRKRRAVGIGAAKTHLSFFIMHGSVLRDLKDELADYDVSRTVIRFTAERPLPASLVRKLVKARIAEIDRSIAPE